MFIRLNCLINLIKKFTQTKLVFVNVPNSVVNNITIFVSVGKATTHRPAFKQYVCKIRRTSENKICIIVFVISFSDCEKGYKL